MTAQIIDGKAFAETINRETGAKAAALRRAHAISPHLVAVLVGDDPASHVYVKSKAKKAAEIGVRGSVRILPHDTPEAELLALLDTLNADDDVDGILVQLPLPRQIDTQAVLDRVDPDKDVDGFHIVNAGRLASGRQPPTVPCTPLGCLLILQRHLGALAGKRALVLGRSTIVGRPMAALLLNEDCTVTIAHSKTADLPAECRRADILVAAVGRPEFVRGDWIKPGAAVIDVGINRVTTASGEKKLVGDVAFAEAREVAGLLTPVPGGVGPMTIACLLLNTVRAAANRRGLPAP